MTAARVLRVLVCSWAGVGSHTGCLGLSSFPFEISLCKEVPALHGDSCWSCFLSVFIIVLVQCVCMCVHVCMMWGHMPWYTLDALWHLYTFISLLAGPGTEFHLSGLPDRHLY